MQKKDSQTNTVEQTILPPTTDEKIDEDTEEQVVNE